MGGRPNRRKRPDKPLATSVATLNFIAKPGR
jgi:hypothetical protein